MGSFGGGPPVKPRVRHTVSFGSPSALLAIVLTPCVLGCGNSPSSGGPNCPAPAGAYSLIVQGLGQSENLSGTCPLGDMMQVSVTFDGGDVEVNGETCAACSTTGCQVDLVCGQRSTCSTGSPAASNADAAYVENASFVLPSFDTDAGTSNAFVELGPHYCVFAGLATRKYP